MNLEAELEAPEAAEEEAEQLAAVEAVAVAVAVEEEARETAAREEATTTPDGRAADGQSKIFDPGGCVPLATAGGYTLHTF